MKSKVLLSVAGALLLTGCKSTQQSSSAAQQPTTESPWVKMTQMDLNAAYQMLKTDHPGASDLVNDRDFQANLERGYATALSRADKVDSFKGYLATMEGLANALGDKHIWSRTDYQHSQRNWAGIVISKRGEDYVVTDHEVEPGKSSLTGASLVSCDAVAAEDFAREKLGGFSAVWSIDAQRIQKAPFLLIDNGNPFVLKPENCTFKLQGKLVQHDMKWRSIKYAKLKDRLKKARNRGVAGFGVSEFDGGMWISIQSLSSKAGAVVKAVKEKAEQLQNSPVVVLDLRGNGGGNSVYGDNVAQVLFGEQRFNAVKGDDVAECGSVWRVTPDNLATMHYYLREFGKDLPDFVERFKPTVDKADAAAKRGEAFSGDINCKTAYHPPAVLPASASKGQIVLLTDNTCFSSCLIVADRFRQLGALHVGQTTDAGTNYMEVREDLMPSGLSYFSTLQAMAPAAPSFYGGFVPDEAYPEDIADTAALQRWISQLIEKRK